MTDHNSRVYLRYGTQPTRLCAVSGCNREADKIGPMCSRCRHRAARFGHPSQTLPASYELDTYVRRMEIARGRLRDELED